MMLIEEKDKRFHVKESTIENAGMGVFASEDIKKENTDYYDRCIKHFRKRVWIFMGS